MSSENENRKLKFVQNFIKCSKDLIYYRVRPHDDLRDIKPSDKPYSREGSYDFFKAVKRNDSELVRSILKKDRF